MPIQIDAEEFLRGATPGNTEPDALSDADLLDQEPSGGGVSHVYHDDTPRELARDEPAPAAPVHDPRDDRLDSLQNTVNQLIMQRQQQQPQQYYPPPQQQQPQGWQPRTFLDKEGANTLLTTQDPAGYLNKTLNQVAESVYMPMLQQLQQRDQILMQMDMQAKQRQQQEQQAQLAQRNINTFYANHPNMAEHSYFVPIEADAMARESQQNPVAFVNKTDVEIYAMLNDRVMARVNGIRSGGTSAAPRRGTAQRTSLERGSGSRAGSSPEPKDPNTKELRGMMNHLRAVR